MRPPRTPVKQKKKIKIPKFIDHIVIFIFIIELLLLISGLAMTFVYELSSDLFTLIRENSLAAENAANVSVYSLIAIQAFIVLYLVYFIYDHMEVKK